MELLFLVFALGMGFLNMAAGRDFFGHLPHGGRFAFAIGGAALSWAFLSVAWWQVVLIAIALFLYRLFDWGEWFAAVHGRKEYWRNKGDVDWEEWLSDKIWPIDPKDGMETRLKSTLDMSIRMVWAMPFAVVTGNFLHMLLFPLLGVTYFLMGFFSEGESIKRAEFLNGLLIAAMLWGA